MKNTRRCKVCRTQFQPRFTMKQATCENPECLAEHGRNEYKKQEEKKRLQKKREDAKWKKEAKERLKTHGNYESDLEETIREISALIDSSVDCCLSCQSKISPTNKANAGHRFAVGGNNSLRFNLDNIHRQGVCCNMHKNGNPDGYDEGMIRVYGKPYYEYVKFELKGIYPLVKMTIPELMAKRALAMKIRNELKKKGLDYSPDERLKLREQINSEIGIYSFGFQTFLESK